MAEMDVSVELRLLDSLSGPARQAFGQFRAAARQAGADCGGLGREAAAAGQAVDQLNASARAAGEATADMGRDGSLRRTAGAAQDAARGMEAFSRSGRQAGDALRQAEAQAGRLRRTLDGVGRGLQNAGRLAGGLRDAGTATAAAGMVGAAALAAPVKRERDYLQDANVAFNDRSEAGIKAGVAELRALDQQAVARGGGTLDSARAMRGAYLAGGVAFADVARLAPLTQRAATAAGAEGADLANTLMAGAKSGQFAYADAEKVFGMMLTAGASGSFEARDMAQYLPGIFNATADMRGLRGTAQHLAGLETIRDATGDSAEAANRYQNLLSFRNSKEAYANLEKKGVKLAHVYSEAAKKGEDMNLAFVGAIQGLVERNAAYRKLKKRLPAATGEEAGKIRNELGAIQNRIFSEIIGDQQARQGAIALVNGRDRYAEVHASLEDRPEAMIDKMFAVMSSSTQENLNRLANEWEKGMDRVLEVVKGPLSSLLQGLSGLMADHPELTAAAGGTAAVAGMSAAGSGALSLLRPGRGKAAASPPVAAPAGQAGGAPSVAASPGQTGGAQAGGQARAAGRGKIGSGAAAKAGAALAVLSAAGQAYATESDDSLTREQKNAAHAETAGGVAGALAGAQAGALFGAVAGPVGAGVGSVVGGFVGGVAGSELGATLYDAHRQGQAALAALPYDADDPEALQAHFRQISARAEASGAGPEQAGGGFGAYWDALFGGGQARPAFADTGEGLEERLAALTRGQEERRQEGQWREALAQAVQEAVRAALQERPLQVELHSTLEVDGSVLAGTVEERLIREAARR